MKPTTPAAAARWHLSEGRQPVPVAKRDKRPCGGAAWHLQRYAPEDLSEAFPQDGNIGLLLGSASGGLVDIDLDCDEAQALGRIYLPSTGMIHGRPSKPATHYWYKVPLDQMTDLETWRAPTSLKGKMLVEYRCSKGDRGYQTVIPPSVHKDSGETLEWLSDGKPAEIDAESLKGACRIVAAGALLARSFPQQGQRHEFALALAGAMLRHGVSEDDAYSFVLEVCRAGGSTEPEKRAAVVRSTARKLAVGDADVTGIPKLREIVGPEVTRKVCDWLGFASEVDQVRKATAELITAAMPTLGLPPPADMPDSAQGEDAPLALKFTDKGAVISCGFNVYELLTKQSAFKDCFKWDDVAKQLVVTGRWKDTDLAVLDIEIADLMMEMVGMNIDKGTVADRLMRVAMENRFDPIADYLTRIKWDGTPRLDTWLERYTGADTTDVPPGFLEFVGRKWMISTVARALNPGCKADLVLILEGEQGIGKSTLFETLGGKWYCDLTVSLHDKDAKMLNAGAWISELPDLASLKRTSEVNAVKAFFSTREDRFRPPYGRHVISSPRRTVYGASTNDLTYLADVTGNRRFCCVRATKIDRVGLLRDRDQLFAEAVALYQRHVDTCENKIECCCWWPTRAEALWVEMEASQRIEDPATMELISAWWSAMAPDERPRRILTTQIAKEALKVGDDRVTKPIAMDIGHSMKRLGFERAQGKVEGQAKVCWYYRPTEKLLALPQVDNQFEDARFSRENRWGARN